MSLPQLSIPSFLDTSSGNLIADFFSPLLTASVRYDRGVGYFSSGWLRAAAAGMTAFAANGGKARWVTSPILDANDWAALQTGDQARTDAALYAALCRNLTTLAETLEQETLSALAWMVADSILDFRLCVPAAKLNGGDFHDKFGIFTDEEGNQVSFNGSCNDSIHGLRNYESIKVFRSWEPAFAPLAQADAARFERLWNNQDPNVHVFDLPDAAREDILRLRTDARPYPAPAGVPFSEVPFSGVPFSGVRTRDRVPPAVSAPSAAPALPAALSLRAYQQEAIAAWFANDNIGILEMATGTGKTITALAASAALCAQRGRLAVVITVPYQHLVDQWRREAREFGYKPVLAYQAKSRWSATLNSQITEFLAGYRPVLAVIATHSTFTSPDFQSALARLESPALLIADEAHHLGAEASRGSYPPNISARLALSATPERWYDADGTDALRDYFGPTVFAFPLEQAIGVSLTPYYYYPHLVSLTDEELERYAQLSARIARQSGRNDEAGQAALKMLLLQRADLLNNAANKLPALADLVDAETHPGHTLFYCAPGQLEATLRLLGWDKGWLVHRFTAEESARERQRLLAEFASGRLHALVAMKCLDEGVDVPDTRTAFLLASSSNPREFIQRRGRVLRRAPGKEFAVIHDLIAVPPAQWTAAQDSAAFAAERSIVRKELQRFKEFAQPAQNKHQALDVVWDMARRYGLLDF